MHIPVLLKESIEAMNLKAGDFVADCTTNRAGHSIEIAKKIGSKGILICIDLDAVALEEAKIFLEKNISKKDLPKMYFVNDNFKNLKKILEDLKIKTLNALIADLGVSSQEIDESGRGFTFQKDEPLFMTLSSNTKNILTAKEIVNNWDEKTIADIIFFYGDERYAKSIAREICTTRKEKEIKTTFDLVEAIKKGVSEKYKFQKIHFATKTFQALRIAVNDELKSEEELLKSLPQVLKENARASIITFHSGEDSIVKNVVKNLKINNKNILKLIKFDKNRIENKSGQDFLSPTKEEIKNNVRSRSAKLRIIKII